jgi:RNA polymerase sigma factor (sigma-70 family)
MTAINDDGLSTFLNARSRLFRIACRVLGSASAAEDVVQEVWIRWQSTDRCAVRDPAAFLTTAAVRLAINLRQSAHSRRESGAVPSFLELVDLDSDQTVRTERAEALTLGVSVLLGRLSYAERAAYILREAFDQSYRDIADVLDVQEANARQIVTRARVRLAQGPRAPVHEEEHRRLLAALSAATQAEDARSLVDLFAAETRQQRHRRNVGPASRDSSRVTRPDRSA